VRDIWDFLQRLSGDLKIYRASGHVAKETMETESSQLGSNGANESELLPVDYPGGEMPASIGSRRGSSVKKHHHKHNLKHRYELLETLGRGTYGKVKKAIERHTGRVVS